MAPCGVVKCRRAAGGVVVRGVGAVDRGGRATVGGAGVAGVQGVVASDPMLVGADPVGMVAVPPHPVAASTTARPAAVVSGRQRVVWRRVGFIDHPGWTGSSGCVTWSRVGMLRVGLELPAAHGDARLGTRSACQQVGDGLLPRQERNGARSGSGADQPTTMLVSGVSPVIVGRQGRVPGSRRDRLVVPGLVEGLWSGRWPPSLRPASTAHTAHAAAESDVASLLWGTGSGEVGSRLGEMRAGGRRRTVRRSSRWLPPRQWHPSGCS